MPPGAEFALCADDSAIYVAIRASQVVSADRLEVFFSPDGTANDFYRFTFGRTDADSATAYYAEGGSIQPDPYAPGWTSVVRTDGNKWTVEARIPLSSFYMTRNADWAGTWLVNAVRRREGTSAFSSWSPLEASVLEPTRFRTLAGFPERRTVEDLRIDSVTAEIAGAQDGSLQGALQLYATVAVAGDYDLTVSSGGTTRLALKAGENRVSVACAYPERGTFATRLKLTHVASGGTLTRDYPVIVDYQPIAVRFARPQYRGNFYPGQDCSTVSGTVSVCSGARATVTLSGPGFATQTKEVESGGTFSFDTAGFEVGEATLTVTSGGETLTRKVRRLAASARRMTWIEDGHLVMDGRAFFRRNMYAEYYMMGDRMTARYNADRASFAMTLDFTSVGIEPEKLIAGLEAREAKKDVRPSADVFARLDEILAANADKDFGCYYICDEPECRQISPVYLRHVYDYVAEKDPYHVISTASRGGKKYAEIADLLETHPYLNAGWNSDGSRRYGTHPREIGSFLDAFEVADRPDKCVGFLPTCFAYRWNSIANDYPTLDEYVLHVWAAVLHGAKTLWPYAGHDIGDRPQLYEGTRYLFQGMAALEDILLFGTKTDFTKSDAVHGATWRYGDARLLVVCNYTDAEQVVALPAGAWREFRGTRTLADSETLPPLGTFVAITGAEDEGLSSLADFRDAVAAQETERTTRDSQVLERYTDMEVTHNLSGNHAGSHKFFDGVRDQLAKYANYTTDDFVEIAFTGFVASFRKVRVWGEGLIENLRVKIRRDGEWVSLEPVATTVDDWMCELDFGVTNRTVKMRLEFPGERNRANKLEIYEIEVPQAGEAGGGVEVEPIADVGVSQRQDASTTAFTNVWSGSRWYAAGVTEPTIRPLDDGAFKITGHVNRYFTFRPGDRWFVIDFRDFYENPGYLSWQANIDSVARLGGTVTYPQAGIYTFRLPEFTAPITKAFIFHDYNFDITVNSMAIVQDPATRVELTVGNGEDAVRPGGRAIVDVRFAVPCEDVSAEFLVTPSGSTGLHPFKVNGVSGIDLRAVDATHTHWRAEIDVQSCGAAGSRDVYVKAVPLGTTENRPVFGNFTVPFVSKPLADLVVGEAQTVVLDSPVRYYMLSNAVSGAEVRFDQTGVATDAAHANRFTGFDAVPDAVTRFRGGWWDFSASNGFFRADSANGGRRTEFSDGAFVTNAGPVEIAGPSGANNSLALKGASSLCADSLVLGRSSKGGQKSRVLVADGSALSVAGDIRFCERPVRGSSALTGNELVVSNSGSRVVCGGTTYLARQYTKAESGGSDNYDGNVGGNTLVVTDRARAALGALYVDNACRHGVSNRVEVSRGALLETAGIYISSGWTSITPTGDFNRFDILDGGIVTNRGSFSFGNYQNSNHRKLTMVVSNGTFYSTANVNASWGLIMGAESEIVVSGPDAHFQVGAYGNSTPLFSEPAFDSRFVIENGASIALPVTGGYGYTHATKRDTVIVRSGARFSSSRICMGSYGGGRPQSQTNGFVVADGASVTAGSFHANSVGGFVTVEDATLSVTNKSNTAFILGDPQDTYESAGRDMTLELKGTRPKVEVTNGRLCFRDGSRLRIVLPADGYAADAGPLVRVAGACVFDAGCGFDLVAADAYAQHLRQRKVKFETCELVEAATLDIPAEALAEANAALPKGLSVTVQEKSGGCQALVLTSDRAAGFLFSIR